MQPSHALKYHVGKQLRCWDLPSHCCKLQVINLTPLPGQPPVKLSPRQLQQLTIPQVRWGILKQDRDQPYRAALAAVCVLLSSGSSASVLWSACLCMAHKSQCSADALWCRSCLPC